MLQFVWIYVWNVTLIPLFILLTKPFNNWTWHSYANYCIPNALKIKHTVTEDEPLIPCGYILANHRSLTDFCLDGAIAESCIMGRRLAVISMNFCSILGMLDGTIFTIIRGRETRQELFARLKHHMETKTKKKRMLFFPEGTRLRYTHLASADEMKTHLKYGMLKCIYEDKMYPVQLQISNNKETVCDESKYMLRYNVPIHTHRSIAIHPGDYKTDTEFYDKIAQVWYECWLKTHVKNE